jgi:catechol 2,3-dioxygenase-like lactoylglutathione lyase family enzyme
MSDRRYTMLHLDHVQLTMPAGAEDLCRRFYVTVLGMDEIDKPPVLAARGGVWLRSGDVQVHLGVEPEFQPARKAHPAIVVANIDELTLTLVSAGYEPLWDEAIPTLRRFFVSDPLGNRIEFIENGHA